MRRTQRSIGLRLAIVLLACASGGGCYVASTTGLTDVSSAVFDDTLLGAWQTEGDGVRLTLARDEWHSYDVTVRDGSGDQRFSARLVSVGALRLFDLTTHGGTETGPALLPVHLLGRVEVQGDTLTVFLLDDGWVRDRLSRGTLAIPAAVTDRTTVLFTAPSAQLRAWLAKNAAAAPAMFSEWATFTRDKS